MINLSYLIGRLSPKLHWILLALCVFGPSTTLASTYVCIGGKSVGFGYDKLQREWNIKKFNADRWVVKKSQWSDKNPEEWIVKKLESTNRLPTFVCGSKDPDPDFGELRCKGLPYPGHFVFSTKTLRYTIAAFSGHHMSGPNSPFKKYEMFKGRETNPPYVEIGKCSSVN